MGLEGGFGFGLGDSISVVLFTVSNTSQLIIISKFSRACYAVFEGLYHRSSHAYSIHANAVNQRLKCDHVAVR